MAGVKKEVEQEIKFEKQQLIEKAATFGVTGEVMAGALYGISEALTAEQAQAEVKAYLSRPVNNE